VRKGLEGRVISRDNLVDDSMSSFCLFCSKSWFEMGMRSARFSVFPRLCPRFLNLLRAHFPMFPNFCLCLRCPTLVLCFLFSGVSCHLRQPKEILIDSDKLTLHGLSQYYINLEENQKTRKLTDLMDILGIMNLKVLSNQFYSIKASFVQSSTKWLSSFETSGERHL
jgi:hypothetical protein